MTTTKTPDHAEAPKTGRTVLVALAIAAVLCVPALLAGAAFGTLPF